jgi:hypothetical protein
MCSAVRNYLYTNKRSGAAGHEEKKKIVFVGKDEAQPSLYSVGYLIRLLGTNERIRLFD